MYRYIATEAHWCVIILSIQYQSFRIRHFLAKQLVDSLAVDPAVLVHN